MALPRSLTFDIASHVLRGIWDRVVQVKDNDYNLCYTAMEAISAKPNNEVSLRTILGLKEPTSQTGVTAKFLNTFFQGFTAQQRMQYFQQDPPRNFDRFMNEMANNSEFRLQITKAKNTPLILLELTARMNRDANPDLYHLSVFQNPTELREQRLHYNVHITQEVPTGQVGRHVYYRFNDVFGPILREDNPPVAPVASRIQAAPAVRIARGPSGPGFTRRAIPRSQLNPAAQEWNPQAGKRRLKTLKPKKNRSKLRSRKNTKLKNFF